MARCPFAQWSAISLHSIHLSQFTHTLTLRATTLCWPPTRSEAFALDQASQPRINRVIALLWHCSDETSNYLHLFAPRLRYGSNCHRPLRVVRVAQVCNFTPFLFVQMQIAA